MHCEFPELQTDASLPLLVEVLGLKGDRVAIERDGSRLSPAPTGPAPLSPTRTSWMLVHFVGAGRLVRPSGRYPNGFRKSRRPRRPLFFSHSLMTLVRHRSVRLPAQIFVRWIAPLFALLLLSPVTGAAHAQATTDLSKPTFVVPEIRPEAGLHLVAYGDMRFTNPSNDSDTNPRVRKWLVDRVAQEKPDALLLSGDLPFFGSNPDDWAIYREETAPWRQAVLPGLHHPGEPGTALQLRKGA